MHQNCFINAFFAIMISNHDSEELINLAKQHIKSPQINWYPPKKLHLTVSYCKHVNINDLQQVKAKKYLTSFITKIQLTELSILNNQMVFLIKNNPSLNLTKQLLTNDLNNHNISYDNRIFIPHITIAYPNASVYDINFTVSKIIQIKSIEIFESKKNNYIKI